MELAVSCFVVVCESSMSAIVGSPLLLGIPMEVDNGCVYWTRRFTRTTFSLSGACNELILFKNHRSV